MKIALAQLNYTIGAFEENVSKILQAVDTARASKSDLVVFSELSVCGYPPLDLLEHKFFIEKCNEAVQHIASCIKDDIAVIVGAPSINTGSEGKNLFNSAYFITNGKIEHVIDKSLLPTYDIFDEYRYFEPSGHQNIVEFKGKRLAITVCEDLWYEQTLLTDFGKNKPYNVNPLEKLNASGFDFIINIAASPFAHNHVSVKESILRENAIKYNKPIVYVNQTGAHTELIFDGASRVIDSKGSTVLQLPSFEELICFIDIDKIIAGKAVMQRLLQEDKISLIHDAIVLGIRDYFRKMGFKNAILGLSGGINSAVSLVLAAKALGAPNVRALLLPSQYSSEHSVTDAIKLADNQHIQYDIVPINDIFSAYLSTLDPVFNNSRPDVTEENIQARIRGALLMAVSNKFGNLLLNTSNKSEAAVGYGTLYGDMMGSLSVLGDIYKTEVYGLARYINRNEEIIPVNSIIKPPSAELRADQKDSDSLPEYELLDGILYNYIELRKSADEIVAAGFDKDVVMRVVKMVNTSEYKRSQAPPVLRVSSKAFGFGRRMPLVAKY